MADWRISIKPIHYAIELFDIELGGSFGFQGLVNAEIDIKSPVASLTLNAHQLKVCSAAVDDIKVQGGSCIILAHSQLRLKLRRK